MIAIKVARLMNIGIIGESHLMWYNFYICYKNDDFGILLVYFWYMNGIFSVYKCECRCYEYKYVW